MFEIIGDRASGKTLKLFSLIEETHYLKGVPYKDMAIVVEGACDYMKEKFFKVTGTYVDFFTPSRFLRLAYINNIKESHIFVDGVDFLFTEALRRSSFELEEINYLSFLNVLKEKLYGYTTRDHALLSAYFNLDMFPDVLRLNDHPGLSRGPLIESFKHFSKDTFETIWLTRNLHQSNGFKCRRFFPMKEPAKMEINI